MKTVKHLKEELQQFDRLLEGISKISENVDRIIKHDDNDFVVLPKESVSRMMKAAQALALSTWQTIQIVEDQLNNK